MGSVAEVWLRAQLLAKDLRDQIASYVTQLEVGPGARGSEAPSGQHDDLIDDADGGEQARDPLALLLKHRDAPISTRSRGDLIELPDDPNGDTGSSSSQDTAELERLVQLAKQPADDRERRELVNLHDPFARAVVTSRPYGVVQGLDEPQRSDQKTLAEKYGRPSGRPALFDRNGKVSEWLRVVNDGGGGPDRPGRDVNCADCALSFVACWKGHPVVSAPRSQTDAETNDWGEVGSGRRIEDVLGAKWHDYGEGDQGFEALERQLEKQGDGAVAVIWVGWAGKTTSHAWNAVRVNGETVWVDPQSGVASKKNWRSGKVSFVRGIITA